MKKVNVLFILIFALISCKKSTPAAGPEPPYYPFTPESLVYIQLPLNSYYIYQDSATGVEDSVVVVTSGLDKTYAPAQGGFSGNSAYYYQIYTLKLQSELTMDDWFSSSASSASFGSSGIFSLDTYHNNLMYSVFIYPVTGRLIPSMEVKGNLYENVGLYEFNNPSSVPAENISVVYYWAKGIGIIKRQVSILRTIKTEELTRHS